MNRRSRVVLVTGASSGIGQCIAQRLASEGFMVYGGSRKPFASETQLLKHIYMDVRDESTVKKALDDILENEGRLDAVINNAGLGMVGPLESATDKETREIFDTNVFGVFNVCRNAAPHLRKNGGGHIVNVTSIAGVIGLPFRGIYCASKFAIEGYTESLSLELAQFGIEVSIIEPGDFKTNINQSRKNTAYVHPAYRRQSEKTLEQVTREVADAPTPEAVGECVLKILNSKSPKLRYRIAKPIQRWSVILKRILPGDVFERLLLRYYNLKKRYPKQLE